MLPYYGSTKAFRPTARTSILMLAWCAEGYGVYLDNSSRQIAASADHVHQNACIGMPTVQDDTSHCRSEKDPLRSALRAQGLSPKLDPSLLWRGFWGLIRAAFSSCVVG